MYLCHVPTVHNPISDVNNSSNVIEKPQPVHVELGDIAKEVNFWQFTTCDWQGVDKVSMIGKGIFLVRFTTMENCNKVLYW